MPDTQTPFRPIHFALRVPDGEVRIYVWKSLDEALATFQSLLPGLRQSLTPDEIRALAKPDWAADDFSRFSYDEYCTLWLAQVVWDPETYMPNERLEELYDVPGALRYAGRLLNETAQSGEPFWCLSEWAESVRPLLFGAGPVQKYVHGKAVRQELLIFGAKACRQCEVPPVGVMFRHEAPNWMICCPICGLATDPREGFSRETALEAWNQGNQGGKYGNEN